jgi:hypothetical protein
MYTIVKLARPYRRARTTVGEITALLVVIERAVERIRDAFRLSW